ncbi:MAG: LCP family protein [bacterium JZ-2024 1]
MRLLVNGIAFFLVALLVSIGVGTVSFLGYAMEDEAFVLERPVSLLIVGVDTEKGHKGRADTIVVTLINTAANRASALSVYRDALLPDGSSARPASSLYARKGMEGLVTSLATLLGIKIDHFVGINHSGFRKAVDLVGGITVDVPYNMFRDDTDPNRRIDLKKGLQRLDGRQALMMVRFRKEPLEDLDRVKNQQRIMRAIIREVFQKKAFHKVPIWYSAIKDDLRTDLSEHDLITMAGFFVRVPPEQWTWESLPGKVSESGRFIPDVEKARERVSNLYRSAQ